MAEKEEKKKLPKSLYDVVSELVSFIDEQDYKRKQENEKKAKDILVNADNNISKGLRK